MNTILDDIIKERNGIYVHALEIDCAYELKERISELYYELIRDYDYTDVEEFILSMQIYCLNDKNEDEVYNFDIQKYILGL